MEWYGISFYGVTNPIKDMLREDYEEPKVQTDLLQVEYKGMFADLVKEIDVYIGQADGYAYKSYDRLIKMRKKGNFKPVGPTEMYRYPGCSSMDYGWHLNNPLLKDETWYKAENKYS